MVKNTPLSVGGKGGQYINIAVGPEIPAQDRPEERKLFYLPLAAEAFDYFVRNLKKRFGNHNRLLLQWSLRPIQATVILFLHLEPSADSQVPEQPRPQARHPGLLQVHDALLPTGWIPATE